MATMRYWDDPTSTWKYVATDPDDPGLVPATGGEITGPLPLVVDAGAVAYDITVDGTLTAKGFTTTKAGVLNVGIRVTAETGRVIDLGGARMQEVGESAEGDSVATKQNVDTFTTTLDAALIALDEADWTVQTQPWVQLDSEGCVSMEGLVKCSTTVEPGAVIGSIPEGFRPRTSAELSTFSMSPAPRYALLEVSPDGGVVYREGPPLTPGCMLSLSGSFYNEEVDHHRN